jgi:hypothetical protein
MKFILSPLGFVLLSIDLKRRKKEKKGEGERGEKIVVIVRCALILLRKNFYSAKVVRS